MISFPWSLILTVMFAYTGFVCVLHLVRHWGASGPCSEVPGARMDAIVHANHLVMSIGMILMVWIDMDTIATWGQVGFFTILAGVMGVGLFRLRGATPTISLCSHIVLNASMVWMLLAMPLLMGRPMNGGDPTDGMHAGGHGGEHEMAHSMTMMPTPDWVLAVNWAAVTLSALAAVWWIVLLVRSRRTGVHTLCHAVMGLGMAAMLALM